MSQGPFNFGMPQQQVAQPWGGGPMGGPGSGAGADPFAYTGGSLLNPWTKTFDYTGGSGGSGVAEFKPFEYGAFNYNYNAPKGFGETYNGPGNFSYADFQGMSPFKAPDAAAMQNDPGYQARLQQGQNAIQASKAAQGVLRTGGAAKALQGHAQELASQEYGNVYGRASSEYDRQYGQARDAYGTNRGNAADTFDRNAKNQLQGYQTRQGAWKDNAAVDLQGQELGFNIATGGWDRNLNLARMGYEDERSHAQSVASAGAAGANQDYNRQMQQYLLERENYWTNQDRQYSMLSGQSQQGQNAATNMGQFAGQYGNNAGNIYMGAGNANAAGRMGSANAWSGALGNLANYGMGYVFNQQRGGE